MNFNIAISPCPNDTFIYGAIANRLIESEITFDFEYHDIQQLNALAMQGIPDLVKMSYYNYFKVRDKYRLLATGGAMGYKCGPLLISKAEFSFENKPTIAIPGFDTTAYFLLQYCIKEDYHVKEMRFDEIEDAILNGDVDAGVIIHENRFTYAQKGLICIEDLGEKWESLTGSPIPLGCLAIKNTIDTSWDSQIENLVRKSIDYAYNHPNTLEDYISMHAQEMDAAVRQAHINLYVNDFSIDIGNLGKKAIDVMYNHITQ